jgi:hypothetical protein
MLDLFFSYKNLESIKKNTNIVSKIKIVNMKNNDQIIQEARKSFEGQWLNVMIATFLPSMILNLVQGFGIFIFVGVIIEGHKLNILEWLLFIIPIVVGNILVFFFQSRFWIWKNNYILEKSRGEEVSYSDFRTVFAGFTSLNEIKASLLNKDQLIKNLYPAIVILITTLSIISGFILLIIPGVIVSFMLALVPFVVVENKNINPIDALIKSSSIMDGFKMKLFWCIVKLIPLYILCLLPCGLGLFWFIPYMSFVLAKFYDAHKQNDNL